MIKLAMIAAFPPPVSGQSLAAKLLYDGLSRDEFDIEKFDISESIGGDPTVERLKKLAVVEIRLLYRCLSDPETVVYMQLGHGRMALIRDLIFMMTAYVTRRPCAAHVHGSGFRKALDTLPGPVRCLEKHLIGQLKAAIVLSRSLRAMFENIVDDEKIIAVDNGIDPEFTAMTEKSARTRTDDAVHVLFLSNFLTAKGFSQVLRAAVMAQKDGKDIIFDFVGAKIAGQDVDIDRFIEENNLKNVTVSDVVTGIDKHRCYQNADIFILPSYYEGQPLSIIEAMFESLPIITTRVGGIPEIFSDDDSCVRYVDPDNPAQIYRAVCELEDSGCRKAMGETARKIACARFTAEHHIKEMTDILREAAQKH